MSFFQKKNLWLFFIFLGPMTAYLAVFNPAISILAIIFLIIGIRGILGDIM